MASQLIINAHHEPTTKGPDMSVKAIQYRSALQNLVDETRRFLSLVPKGHPERHNAIVAHRAACEIVARLAKTEGEHEYRAEILAELAEMFDG